MVVGAAQFDWFHSCSTSITWSVKFKPFRKLNRNNGGARRTTAGIGFEMIGHKNTHLRNPRYVVKVPGLEYVIVILLRHSNDRLQAKCEITHF